MIFLREDTKARRVRIPKQAKKEINAIPSFQNHEVPVIELLIPSNKKLNGLILKIIPIGSFIFSIANGKNKPEIHCKNTGSIDNKLLTSFEIDAYGEIINLIIFNRA